MKRITFILLLLFSFAATGQVINARSPYKVPVAAASYPVQNLLLWAEDYTQPDWNNTSGNIAITTGAGTDFVGGNTMNQLNVTGGAGGDIHQIIGSLTASTTYYWSFDAYTGTNTGAEYKIWDWDHFTVIQNFTSYISMISPTVSRVQISFTTNAANTTINLIAYNSPFTNGTIFLGRQQLATTSTASYGTTTTSIIP